MANKRYVWLVTGNEGRGPFIAGLWSSAAKAVMGVRESVESSWGSLPIAWNARHNKSGQIVSLTAERTRTNPYDAIRKIEFAFEKREVL